MSLDWLGDVLQKDADDRDRYKRWYSLSDEQKDTLENLLASGILGPYISSNWVDTIVKDIIWDIDKRNRDDIPEACRHCSNHPSNGGSGVCLCTLGGPKITYS